MPQTEDSFSASSDGKRCGFISLLGLPNVGKSTLTNALVGAKISVVTHKRQTTRAPARGIVNAGLAQLVFIDTPGVFPAKLVFDQVLVRTAWQSALNSDATLVVLDARRGLGQDHSSILRFLRNGKQAGGPAFFAINKIDLVADHRVLAVMQDLKQLGFHDNIFPTSARTGRGLETLREHLARVMPHSAWLFPEGMISDRSCSLQMAEITRESILLLVHEEVPYRVMVETERMEARGNKCLLVHQVITVRHAGHKRIIIGSRGSRIKTIGERSRRQMEHQFGKRIFLSLFVKIDPNWQSRRDCYEVSGLEGPDRTVQKIRTERASWFASCPGTA